MENIKTRCGSFIKRTLMIVSIILVLFVIPLVFINTKIFEEYLISSGIINSPNLKDGYLIAEFNDPAGDLLLQLPHETIYDNAQNTLDIRNFSIKKVAFNSLSGVGIDARLNVCMEFDGKQPNPFDFKNGFSFLVIHVYLKTPDTKKTQIMSDKTVNVNFNEGGWDYQVIIDGMHEQARVFDNTGKFLFNGLGLYVKFEYEKGYKEKQNHITKTIITAGLPLELIGDPAVGRWEYYVLTGLLDIKNPSMLYQSDINSLNVFDLVMPDTSSTNEISSAKQPILFPLIVEYSKFQN